VNDGRVIVHDASERRLRKFWRLARSFDGTPHHYGVSSPGELYAVLEMHVERHGPIRGLQLWGHARAGRFFYNRIPVSFITLGSRIDVRRYLWLRGCEYAERPNTVRFVARELGCVVVAHTKAISAEPRWAPWIQGGLVACRPDDPLFWSPKTDRYVLGPKRGKRLPSCWVTRMEPPAKAFMD